MGAFRAGARACVCLRVRAREARFARKLGARAPARHRFARKLAAALFGCRAARRRAAFRATAQRSVVRRRFDERLRPILRSDGGRRT